MLYDDFTELFFCLINTLCYYINRFDQQLARVPCQRSKRSSTRGSRCSNRSRCRSRAPTTRSSASTSRKPPRVAPALLARRAASFRSLLLHVSGRLFLSDLHRFLSIKSIVLRTSLWAEGEAICKALFSNHCLQINYDCFGYALEIASSLFNAGAPRKTIREDSQNDGSLTNRINFADVDIFYNKC